MKKTEAVAIVKCLRSALAELDKAVILIEGIDDQNLKDSLRKTIITAIGDIVVDAVCEIEKLKGS